MDEFDLHINRAIGALMYGNQNRNQTIELLVNEGVTKSDSFLIVIAAESLIKKY